MSHEILLEEISSVGLEIYELEKRQNNNINCTFSHFRPLMILMFVRESKIFNLKILVQIKRNSTENFMEYIEEAVWKKENIQNPDASSNIAQHSWPVPFYPDHGKKKQDSWYFYLLAPSNKTMSIEILTEQMKKIVLNKIQFDYHYEK